MVGWYCRTASSICVPSGQSSFFLVYLDKREWTGELAGVPEVLNQEVGDCNGFCASCDSNAPLSGLEKFLGGGWFVGVKTASSDDFT